MMSEPYPTRCVRCGGQGAGPVLIFGHEDHARAVLDGSGIAAVRSRAPAPWLLAWLTLCVSCGESSPFPGPGALIEDGTRGDLFELLTDPGMRSSIVPVASTPIEATDGSRWEWHRFEDNRPQ